MSTQNQRKNRGQGNARRNRQRPPAIQPMATDVTLVFNQERERFTRSLVATTDYLIHGGPQHGRYAKARPASRFLLLPGQPYQVDLYWNKNHNALIAVPRDARKLAQEGKLQFRQIETVRVHSLDREKNGNEVAHLVDRLTGAPVFLAKDMDSYPKPNDARPVFLVSKGRSGVLFISRDARYADEIAQNPDEEETVVNWLDKLTLPVVPMHFDLRRIGVYKDDKRIADSVQTPVEEILGLDFIANPDQIDRALDSKRKVFTRANSPDKVQLLVGKGVDEEFYRQWSGGFAQMISLFDEAARYMRNRWEQYVERESNTSGASPAFTARLRTLANRRKANEAMGRNAQSRTVACPGCNKEYVVVDAVATQATCGHCQTQFQLPEVVTPGPAPKPNPEPAPIQSEEAPKASTVETKPDEIVSCPGCNKRNRVRLEMVNQARCGHCKSALFPPREDEDATQITTPDTSAVLVTTETAAPEAIKPESTAPKKTTKTKSVKAVTWDEVVKAGIKRNRLPVCEALQEAFGTNDPREVEGDWDELRKTVEVALDSFPEYNEERGDLIARKLLQVQQ